MNGQGKVNRFFVANGMSELRKGGGHDVSPFSMMDGSIDDNIEFSNARGSKLRKKKPSKRKTGRKKTTGKFVDKFHERQDRRLAIKEQQAKSQQAVAENIGKTSPEEAKLMEQLAQTTPDTNANPTAKTGMKPALKWGLIIGGVAVVGVVVFIVIKKMKKK